MGLALLVEMLQSAEIHVTYFVLRCGAIWKANAGENYPASPPPMLRTEIPPLHTRRRVQF